MGSSLNQVSKNIPTITKEELENLSFDKDDEYFDNDDNDIDFLPPITKKDKLPPINNNINISNNNLTDDIDYEDTT